MNQIDDNHIETECIYSPEKSASLVNNNQELANDLLVMFVQELPEQLADINKALETNDILTIAKRVHKILGATAYCHAPRIRNAAFVIQKAVKNPENNLLTQHINRLNQEVTKLLEYFKESDLAKQ